MDLKANRKIYIKPEIISFTGIDNFTDIDSLDYIYNKYVNIEFGICLDIRIFNPEDNIFKPLLNKLEGYSHLPWVAHLSEELVHSILQNKRSAFLKAISWKRIQYNIDWTKIKSILKTIDFIASFTEQLGPSIHAIIPEDKSSRAILKRCDLPNSINLICDVSKGKGLFPTKNNTWSYPYHNYFGYAGGINLNNVQKAIDLISNMMKNTVTKYWIDMESALRCKTTKRFQANKMAEILEKIETL